VTEAEKKRIADQRAENVRIQKEKIREGGENVKSKLTKENMIRALEIASFFIPAGAAFNAIRLGYKAYKAGKKVTQFSKIGKNNIAQLKAKRDAAKEAGDTASVKLYNKQLQQAGGQAQGKVNAASANKFQANKAASKATGVAAGTGVAAVGVKAASGKDKRIEEAKQSKPKTGGSTTAADRASAIRNSGQTVAKKAKVAPKTIVGNEYSSKLKRNLSDFEQAFADARREKQDVFTFKGKKYSTKVKK
jgi:hypothetical protein